MDLNNIETIRPCHKEPGQYGYRLDSIDAIIPYLSGAGDFIQFGVSTGKSARYLLSLMPKDKKLFLLDSFEGLPEAWKENGQPKGAFALDDKSIPIFNDERVTIIRGWFKESVKHLDKLTKRILFIHIDCDLYSSTIDALFGVNELITNPCYILFDEFYNYPKSENCEYKAFLEFTEYFKLQYKPLFKTAGKQVAFEVYK